MNGLLSIIIPTLNEENIITNTLEKLEVLRAAGHEVIVVDGGSCDKTYSVAAQYADSVLLAEEGRGWQMNAGAEYANNEILLFLHADTRLPDNVDKLINQALQEDGKSWGRFDVRLSGKAKLLRVVERMINWRSCFTGIATGDQAIFVKTSTFKQIDGFADIPLMEDLDLSRRLKRIERPVCIKTPVITSSRRWEENGIIRTILLMWSLRLAYSLGVSPETLSKYY
ncbi:TIGR04283 family arsenosugar biosynthesis glycosyltransferase [Candidatus Marithrix sp. Canyon 246]|uniref:TIGR04283 family arsenosugar biosynthesis glycosyltransferase n=1 Tax=Candidatus Marithrix sp. Canyon 246 TaxID=1827136 RepID=UPI000A5E70B0|nr:TIGR04283 family arsenosugar biosynthesis glycosyltransferase [Candidatus Marithrix sp. Canyon 246]